VSLFRRVVLNQINYVFQITQL